MSREGLMLAAPPPANDSEVYRLQRRVAALEGDIDLLRDQLDKAQAHNLQLMNSVLSLKRNLTPLYHSLQVLFGDMDAVNDAPQSAVEHPHRKIYQEWVARFGADTLNGKAVRALLDLGPMKRDALRVALKCSTGSVQNTLDRLRKHGLIVKENGQYKLKDL